MLPSLNFPQESRIFNDASNEHISSIKIVVAAMIFEAILFVGRAAVACLRDRMIKKHEPEEETAYIKEKRAENIVLKAKNDDFEEKYQYVLNVIRRVPHLNTKFLACLNDSPNMSVPIKELPPSTIRLTHSVLIENSREMRRWNYNFKLICRIKDFTERYPAFVSEVKEEIKKIPQEKRINTLAITNIPLEI